MKIKTIVWQIIAAVVSIGLTFGTAFIGLALRRNELTYGSLFYILTFVFIVFSIVFLVMVIGAYRKSRSTNYKGDLKTEFARWDKQQKVDT